jgi:hypothetical protein
VIVINDYYAELLSRERIKTFYQEADDYRLVQQTRSQKTRGFSRFRIFQQLMAFWRTKKFQARDSRGGENV